MASCFLIGAVIERTDYISFFCIIQTISVMESNSGIYKSTKGKVFINDLGILVQTYHDNASLTINDAREDFQIYKELCKSIKRPVLVDIRNIRSVKRKARMLYSGREAINYLTAAALLIGNPVSRIIGNFYMGLNKTVFPLRLFTNQKDALKWLKSYI